ncbi:MAG: hypothetical protein ACK5KO_03655 [Arachnia sp.]
MSTFVDWSALGTVVMFGVIVGAGLPALFAVAVRLLAGPGLPQGGQIPTARRAVAYSCFALICLAIVVAVVYIAAGGH